MKKRYNGISVIAVRAISLVATGVVFANRLDHIGRGPNGSVNGDAARSRDSGGIDVGLTLAGRLAQAHGGTITASDHTEGGPLFTFTLPVAEAGEG